MNNKKRVWPIVLLVACAFLVKSCHAKSRLETICEFRLNQACFEEAASLLDVPDWEKKKGRFGVYRESELPFYIVNDQMTKRLHFPQDEARLQRSLDRLFSWFGLWYCSVSRTPSSDNTIVFKQMLGYDFPFRRICSQGVAYVVDGGTPNPELNADMAVDTIYEIGDGWYFWHGYTYPY